MAAKPKLSPEEWKHVRDVWELDTRKGFVWLIEELSLPVSAEAIRLRSKSEDWKRKNKPSLGSKKNKVARSNKKSTSEKVRRKRNTAKARAVIDDAKNKKDIGGEENNHGNSRYCEKYNDEVFRMCLLGATDGIIAEAFGVTEQTINNWKKSHPVFFESMKRGKIFADSNAAYGFYRRTTGYRYSEVKKKVIYGGDEDEVNDAIDDDSDKKGSKKGVVIEVTTTEKEVAPDAKAALSWLNNRQPDYWKYKVDPSSVEVTFDKEMLQQIEETFLARMEKARARQDKILIERGILIEQEAAD